MHKKFRHHIWNFVKGIVKPSCAAQLNFLFCCKMPPIHLPRSVKEIDKLKTIVNRRESIDGLETHKNYNISH